ncbi:anthranilate synthase component II [Stackebrandtia soli]|uniref:anthranilate synthase component II n=1 Tax=Stackebrandtia soli TaxID=1892856 RepID=UPI0039EBAEDF
MPRVLVADCRDSFVYTIVDYLASLGADVDVRRAETIDVDGVAAPDAVLLSPGPGAPDEAEACHRLIDRFAGRVPILGVCLGHQVIAQHYGVPVVRAPQPCHGETARVRHDGRGVFSGLPQPLTVTRYHSLVVDEGDFGPLAVTAREETGLVMGLRHRRLPIEGVQFHPEAVLSESGHGLFGNWLAGVVAGTEGHRQETLSAISRSVVTVDRASSRA